MKIWWVFSGCVGALILVPALTFAQSEKCVRLVSSSISVQGEDYSEYIISETFDNVFNSRAAGGGPSLHEGPIHVEYVEYLYKSMVDYLFVGELHSAKGSKTVTLQVQLVDLACNSVVRKEEISWYADDQSFLDLIKKLASKFMPLGDILYNYERIPLSAEIYVPNNEVGSGNMVKIGIRKLRHNDKMPQPWQMIAVKVEKGEILNGELLGGYYYFPVGEKGYIDVQYKAPGECKEQEDVISVYNTCILQLQGENRSYSSLVKDEIGRHSFQVVCYSGEMVTELEWSSPVFSGHEVAKMYFRYAGPDKIRGVGAMPDLMKIYNIPSGIECLRNTSLSGKMEGWIKKGSAGKRVLEFEVTPQFLDQTMECSNSSVMMSVGIRLDYEQSVCETEIHRKGTDGGWFYFNYIVDSTGQYLDYFAYGCGPKGDCGICTATMNGPVIKVTCCDSDGECNETVLPPTYPVMLSSHPSKGDIEWKNGAVKPLDFSSGDVRIVGSATLILYEEK